MQLNNKNILYYIITLTKLEYKQKCTNVKWVDYKLKMFIYNISCINIVLFYHKIYNSVSIQTNKDTISI